MIQRENHHAHTRDGWRLGLRRVFDDAALIPTRRPVLLIPGYGMNTFLFGYHPAGTPLEDHLAGAGFEVWSLSLRTQDGSASDNGSRDHTVRDVAVLDLNAAVETILAETHAEAERVDMVGCSLGGTMVYAHLALVPDNRVHSVAALGAPLRWLDPHFLMRAAFASSWVARHLRVKGSRRYARWLLRGVQRAPRLLTFYIHPDLIDMEHADQFVRAVEDPNPVLNEEMSRWLRNKDLIIDGINITDALREMHNPLLVLTGNDDGLVPIPEARFPLSWIASRDTAFIEVGDAERKFAHADLYLSRYSPELVFEPLARWLAGRYDPHQHP